MGKTIKNSLIAFIHKNVRTISQIRREFKAITSFEVNHMDDWPEWRNKIFEFAKTESLSRPNIKKVLGKLQTSEYEDKEGMVYVFWLTLKY